MLLLMILKKNGVLLGGLRFGLLMLIFFKYWGGLVFFLILKWIFDGWKVGLLLFMLFKVILIEVWLYKGGVVEKFKDW